MSYFMFQTFASLTHGFNEASKLQGAGAGAELDEIKRMLVETNPWFLGVTAIVSVLHMVCVNFSFLFKAVLVDIPWFVINRFEMLAFKSDVSHWRQKRELVGVSVR
jgi:hypothetical protein